MEKERSITSYKDLLAWQLSMKLAKLVYCLTNSLPQIEKYGLSDQLRRAVVSIPSNIAEGSRRGTRRDYRKFVLNAFGSGAEVETQLLLLQELDYGNKTLLKDSIDLTDRVMRILNRLEKSLT